MTAASIPTAPPRILAGTARELFRREPLFANATLVLTILLAPLLVAHNVDARLFLGINIWTKPIKFAVALIVYLGTLAWIAGWLPTDMTSQRGYRIFSRVVVACVAAEMVWIVGAAAAGTASHFNYSIPLMKAVYPVMGMLAIIITSASFVYGRAIWLDGNSQLNPALQLSVALGLVLTFVTTVVAASVLASGTGHFVGASASDAGRLALMGWSRTGGDLRVAHFFATHAMHALPIVGLLVSPWGHRAWARYSVVGAGVAYLLLIAYALVGALLGRPFLPALHL